MYRALFTWKWILTTVLVLIAAAVMVFLGLWQLDRLEQRRALNDRVRVQMEATTLDLNQAATQAVSLEGTDLYEMEYRSVVVRGMYDHSEEVALRNQTYNNRLGVHLFTPLKIAGSDQAILVDRGWIAMEDFEAGDWSAFEEPGEIVVQGIFRRSRSLPDMGRQVDPPYRPGEPRLTAFSTANMERIGKQIPYEILPVYVQQLPQEGQAGPPIRSQLNIVLTERNHLGYAIQWFTFAAILVAGYPFFVKREIE